MHLPGVAVTDVQVNVAARIMRIATWGRGVWEMNLAPVIYVDAASTGGADGSLQHPYPTVGQAYAAAQDGYVISIAGGMYTEATVSYSKRVSLVSRGGVAIIR